MQDLPSGASVAIASAVALLFQEEKTRLDDKYSYVTSVSRNVPIEAQRFRCGRNDPCPCKSGKKYKVCCKK